MHRQHKHRQRWMMSMNVSHQLQAIPFSERDVDDTDIRFQLADRHPRLALALRLTDNDQIRLFIDHQTQTLPHDRMIVHDEHLALATERRAGVLTMRTHGSSGQVQRTETPPPSAASRVRSP